MRNKSKKNHILSKKKGKKPDQRNIFFLPICILFLLFATGFSFFFIGKSVSRSMFYKNYSRFIEVTKVVLYPDMMQKDETANLNQWIIFTKQFLKKNPTDLIKLTPYVTQIEQKAMENKREEAKKLIMDVRVLMLSVLKNKQYYSQTIMMEDLLSLVQEMEKTVEMKDDLKLMEHYQNFKSKFTFVIPVLIKSDVLKIGEAMDLLYKKALYQNMDEAKNVYEDVNEFFIQAYRDYKVR